MTDDRSAEPSPRERGAIYRRLGVEPLINGRSTFTILGGSLMPPEVLEAMRQAAEAFVDLEEIGAAVGRRIAQLTRNEAAFVSGGAAAGLFLAAVACRVRGTADGVASPGLLRGDTLPAEFVVHRAHWVEYLDAIELAGGRVVEIGSEDGSHTGDLERSLEAALGASTAGVVYVPKAYLAARVLDLATVIRLAHARGIPVVVDAAAQLPPVDNLWRYTEVGADLVLFSGGKGLRGPASSGLVLGRAELVDLVARNAAPLHRVGRPMKVGKEDMVGLLAAVEWYLAQDHGATARQHSEVVDRIVEWGRGRSDIDSGREDIGEAGQPTPRAHIRLIAAGREARDEVLAALRAGRPRIDLLADEATGFYVAPETLQPDEETAITRRLDEVLDARRRER
jgi:D-glucosaminate-6-phosphate ammonia-lyase